MKLKQVNEDQKCPQCKKFTLVGGYGYFVNLKRVFMTHSNVINIGGLSENFLAMHPLNWNWQCTNCNAQFIDEDLKNANKTNNKKTIGKK